ncbi:hypothetical protein PV326_011112, partial [Microctonus aethiopoides]
KCTTPLKKFSLEKKSVYLTTPVAIDGTDQFISQTTSSSSMEDMLKKFMEQQSTFNKNMTDSMTQQTQALKRQAKIAALSNDNQKLSSEVCLLKQSDTINTSKLSSKIIISGVPQTVSNNPLTAISKILHSIDASHQVEDILDIRSVNKKHDNTTSTLPAEIKSTFIINFKSPQIASHVVDKKRRYETHALYRRVKEVARDIKCKFVWVKQGCIFARMNDGAEKINIRSHADLDAFKAS